MICESAYVTEQACKVLRNSHLKCKSSGMSIKILKIHILQWNLSKQSTLGTMIFIQNWQEFELDTVG